MTDYKNGKIYKITSAETEDVYIGSTCATLKTRLCNHKSAFKGTNRTCTAKNVLKYADARIELIENFPCETRQELLNREGVVTKNTPNCVNTQIQGRTMTEYRNDNADKLKQQSADYRTNNKELLDIKYKQWYQSESGRAYYERKNAKVKVKVLCGVCSKETSKTNIARHLKTHKE